MHISQICISGWYVHLDTTLYPPQVNVIGYMALIRLFLPGMLRQGRGHVVNVSSISATEVRRSARSMVMSATLSLVIILLFTPLPNTP